VKKVSFNQYFIISEIILSRHPHANQTHVSSNFFNWRQNKKFGNGFQDPKWVYAVLDYINFKGEGLGEESKYGLFDVLKWSQGDVESLVEIATRLLNGRTDVPPTTKVWWGERLKTYRGGLPPI
jgi:hypothetical protein